MKLTTVIILAACLSAAATGNSQSVTLNVKEAPLEKVFTEIRKQTGFNFLFSSKEIKEAGKVTLQVSNASIEQVLNLCFKNKPFEYSIENNTIVVKFKIANPTKEGEATSHDSRLTIDIHGRILNEKGEPIAGASVQVKGNKNLGTSTDANGSFELKGVDENATLVISGVNIETFEVKVNGRTDLAVLSAKTKVTEGEEVTISVNTGYQSIKPERFVGSFSKLDSAAYHRRVGMNIIDRLDNTVTGMLFTRRGGNAPIQVRGISTLNGTMSDPLIIVDNFPFNGNLNNINQNDVEDITVLKDAAAASIWGAKAGNGVIVITTRSGKFKKPLSISATSNQIIQQKSDLFSYPQLSNNDFIEVEKYLFDKGFYNNNLTNTSNRPIVSPVVEILNKQRSGLITQVEADAQIQELAQIDVRKDLNKFVYQNSISQQHHIKLDGGTDKMSYALSLGYNRNQPGIKNSESDNQFTIHSTNVFRPVKNFQFELGIALTKTINQSVSLGSEGVGYPGRIYPYAQLADTDGNALAIPNLIRQTYTDTAGGGKLLNWQYRPLDEIRNADFSNKQFFGRFNLGFSYQFRKWIKAEVKYQYIEQNSDIRNYFNQASYYSRNLINLFTQVSGNTVTRNIPLGGILDLTHNRSSAQNLRGQISFNQNWQNMHELTGLVAGEVSESKSSYSKNRFYGYNDATTTYTTNLNYIMAYPIYGGLQGSTRIPQQSLVDEGSINRFVSLLANVSYTYKKRYSVYASGRRDGSNVFGVNTNNKWKPLWSTGAKWDIRQENFIKLDFVSSLSLRASLGYMGNVDNSRSGLPTIIYTTPAAYSGFPTARVGDPPNPDLRWEQVRMINFGLDFGLMKNRLTGMIEWFKKNSTDIISGTPVDPTTGINQFAVNIASLEGKGIEFNLNSKNLVGKFKWNTMFGFTRSKTIVEKYPNGGFRANQFINYSINPSEGQIAWGISSYRWAGLDPLTGDPQGYFNKVVSKAYNSIINDSLSNQVFHGSSIPLNFGFLNNSFQWGGFSLSAIISYRLNYFFRRPTINYTDLYNSWTGHNDYVLRWKQPGDEAATNVPSMNYPANQFRDQLYVFSEINVKRADNIRLQDIRFDYSWENNSTKIPVKAFRIYVYASNLNGMIWRKDKSVRDPDNANTLVRSRAIWTTGINLNF